MYVFNMYVCMQASKEEMAKGQRKKKHDQTVRTCKFTNGLKCWLISLNL